MLPRDYEEQNCAVASALEVIGERWTLLIVRDAFLGVSRFEDFQARLGVSRTVLAARLSQLVEDDVLRRERYRDRPERFEYLLTERGLGLWPVIASIAQWGGGQFAPGEVPRYFRHGACGTLVTTQVTCPACEVVLSPEEIVTGSFPGAEVSRAGHLAESVRAELGRERPLLTGVRDGPAGNSN
jgi:DNA-binding HxlR family transcriptional regulator